MSEELKDFQNEVGAEDFDIIKKMASKNIGSLLKDLQDFERAIADEEIAEIYRIYNGRLHTELKQTSNKNHEIDDLLARKLQDRFIEKFPFMQQVEKATPTLNYFKIGQYYRERATIGLDSSIPEIFILPEVAQEWEDYAERSEEALEQIEQQMDAFDAKLMTARVELERINSQLKKIQQRKDAIEAERGFFNRGKFEEEELTLEDAKERFLKEKQEWLPYTDQQSRVQQQREYLVAQYEETKIKRAIVLKERRLINKYFGSLEQMYLAIQDFLNDYLKVSNGQEGRENDEGI